MYNAFHNGVITGANMYSFLVLGLIPGTNIQISFAAWLALIPVFIIIYLITFPFIYAFSQIKIGLKAGIDFCNVKFPEPSDTKTRVAFYSGLQTEIAAGKKFILQPELLYLQKGFRFSPIATSSGGHVGINYISVPLLVGYRPTDKLKVLIGPELII